MKKVINRGFTLIELLVVIAIIGILASIVLVSLNSARGKGKDARLLSDVNQVRTQIETEANSAGTYQVAAGNCVTANPVAANGNATLNAASNPCAALVTDATNNTPSGSLTVRTNTAGGSSFTAYLVYVTLNSPTSATYCVDSTGQAKTLAAAPVAGITCQ